MEKNARTCVGRDAEDLLLFFPSRCLPSLHLFSQPEHVEMRFAAQCFLLCGVQAERLLMEAENYENVGLRGELLEETTEYIGSLMTILDV